MQYPRFFLPCLALLIACPSAEEPLEDGTGDGSVNRDVNRDPSGAEAATPDEDEAEQAEPPGLMRTLELFDALRLSSDRADEHFQKAESELDFGAGPFANVTLFVDLDTTCFPFSRWDEEDIPEGHNFPPSCDAVDRNFEITLDEPRRRSDPLAIDVMRAVTPFGGPMHLEVDLTDLANARPGKHRLQAMIGTWSDPNGAISGAHGGWNVSAHIVLTTGAPPAKVLAVSALFNQLLGEGQDSIAAPFELPEGTKQIRIELRTTGHDGGEEFCTRQHSLKLDGRMLEHFEITRYDCADECTLVGKPGAQYCRENPTGVPELVAEPRAGWCPGTLAAPRIWTLAAHGKHSLEYAVDHIAAGGNIRASAVVYALGE